MNKDINNDNKLKSIKLRDLNVGDSFAIRLTLKNREAFIVDSIEEKKITCTSKTTGRPKEILFKDFHTCFLLHGE